MSEFIQTLFLISLLFIKVDTFCATERHQPVLSGTEALEQLSGCG